MRATTVIIGLTFSTLLLFGDSVEIVIGTFGLLASLALWAHRWSGFVLLLVPAGFSALTVFTVDAYMIIGAIVYGVLALMARQAAMQHDRNEARAERMDRYVRQQLGE